MALHLADMELPFKSPLVRTSRFLGLVLGEHNGEAFAPATWWLLRPPGAVPRPLPIEIAVAPEPDPVVGPDMITDPAGDAAERISVLVNSALTGGPGNDCMSGGFGSDVVWAMDAAVDSILADDEDTLFKEPWDVLL